MPNVGVVLSGCGVYDGSEIHEAVLTLLALDRAGADIKCLAPDITQMHVIDHLEGHEVAHEKRSVLIESARIARGNIDALAGCDVGELDAVILPGGFGAAKNLCDFAVNGINLSVDPVVNDFLIECNEAGKPLGFICIAPVIAAKVFGSKKPVLTIGDDPDTASAIENLGAKHKDCPADDCIVDKRNKIVTTPAYMLAGSIREAADGIEKLVEEVLALVD